MFNQGSIVLLPMSQWKLRGKFAIVLKATEKATMVQTGSAELVYDPADLALYATITLNVKRYGTLGKRRIHRVRFDFADGGAPQFIEVCTKMPDQLGEITAALDVRKLAFVEWKQRDEKAVSVCPHVIACKASVLGEWANNSGLAAAFEARTVCNERDADRARRCARRLGFENEE